MKTISVQDDRILIQLYKEGNEDAFDIKTKFFDL